MTGIFLVSNSAVMTKEIKSQIFQRSFSTKGVGRGIGTYSIKLFTENYLGAKVSFSTEKRKGTIFNIELPLELL
jgi:sensor histidine kinase regulating citrate/malate metabolism